MKIISARCIPYCILIFAPAYFSFFSNLYDDAYIHARIVDNFLRFGSFSYNLGDVFKASSSTGYISLITITNLFTSDSVFSIRFINFAALISYGIVTYKLWAITNSNLSKLSSIVPLPFVYGASWGGMEVTISLVCLLAAALFLIRKKYAWALFVSSISILFRVEFALFFLLIWSYIFLVNGFRARHLFSLLPIISLLIFDYLFYGSVIPHAATVKSAAYNYPWASSLINAASLSSGGAWLVLFLPLYLFFAYLLLYQACLLRRQGATGGRPYFVFWLFSFGVLFAWAIARSKIFPWYLPILATGLSLTIFFFFHERGFKPHQALTKKKAVSVVAVLGMLALAGNGYVKLYKGHSPFNFTASERVLEYLRIAGGLYEHCPSCSLMTSEIGGLGYGFKGTVYDGFGLGDPVAEKFHPMKVPEQRQSYAIGAIPLGYINQRLPDFVVSMPIFTFEFRNSSAYGNYYHYSCPFLVGSSLWGDSGIYIHSKEELDMKLLKTINCYKG